MTTKWYPAALLEKKATKPYGILILNQPINKNALNAVIDHAALLVCADAGGDRFMAYGKNASMQKRVPDAIIGDLDSLSKEAEEHWRSEGVKIIKDPDQYSTDFTKSLKWMRETWDSQKGIDEELDIIVLGGLGGRVDQGFSQIHHLYMVHQQSDLLKGFIYLLSEQSLSFVLAAGKNEVHVGKEVFAENIGIIPVLGLTHITTTGLEWDVSDWPTEFGHQVSTSNHIRSETITVSVGDRLPLLTLELAKGLCAESV